MGVTDFPELSRKVTVSVGSIIGLMVISAWITWGAAAIWWDFKLVDQRQQHIEERIENAIESTNGRIDRKVKKVEEKIEEKHKNDGSN